MSARMMKELGPNISSYVDHRVRARLGILHTPGVVAGFLAIVVLALFLAASPHERAERADQVGAATTWLRDHCKSSIGGRRIVYAAAEAIAAGLGQPDADADAPAPERPQWTLFFLSQASRVVDLERLVRDEPNAGRFRTLLDHMHQDIPARPVSFS